jgi:hypothetical protein
VGAEPRTTSWTAAARAGGPSPSPATPGPAATANRSGLRRHGHLWASLQFSALHHRHGVQHRLLSGGATTSRAYARRSRIRRADRALGAVRRVSPILRLHSTSNPFNSKEPWKRSPESRETIDAFMRCATG